jgi:[ribosomal protein S5]-alanine N-acetyltransferase
MFSRFPNKNLTLSDLRELHINDAQRYYDYLSNEDVNKFVSQDDTPSSVVVAKADILYWNSLFYQKRSFYWGISNKENDDLIGSIGFNHWNKVHNRLEVSYDLDRDFWHKGIMTEALKYICLFGFEKMNATRIQATVAVDNKASIKLLEKCGFKCEGLMRDYGLLHGKNHDFYMYGLIREVL